MALLLSEKNAEILQDTEHAQLWDLLIHQEKGLTGRTNFFLVAESMFLVAFSIMFALNPGKAGIFAIGGLTLSLLWLVLQYKTFSDLSKLSARLREVEISKHYLAWRAECRNFMISHEVIAVVIPALCLTGWFIVLAFNS